MLVCKILELRQFGQTMYTS